MTERLHDDANDPVVVRVSSPAGQHVDHFTIGDPPPGFVEEVLVPSPPRDVTLVASVDDGVLYESFALDDLVPERIHFEDRDVTEDEFRQQARTACRTWDQEPGTGLGWIGLLALIISVPMWFYRRSFPPRDQGVPARPDVSS